MTPEVYQRLAARTECDQRRSIARMAFMSMKEGREYSDKGLFHIRLNHGIIGLTGEVGELAAELERAVYYGHDLDHANLAEEIGDCLWYLSLLCNTLGLDMGKVMEGNIAKLKARYPDKYSDWNAREENRDRDTERQAMDAHARTCQSDGCGINIDPRRDNPLANPAGLSPSDTPAVQLTTAPYCRAGRKCETCGGHGYTDSMFVDGPIECGVCNGTGFIQEAK